MLFRQWVNLLISEFWARVLGIVWFLIAPCMTYLFMNSAKPNLRNFKTQQEVWKQWNWCSDSTNHSLTNPSIVLEKSSLAKPRLFLRHISKRWSESRVGTTLIWAKKQKINSLRKCSQPHNWVLEKGTSTAIQRVTSLWMFIKAIYKSKISSQSLLSFLHRNLGRKK